MAREPIAMLLAAALLTAACGSSIQTGGSPAAPSASPGMTSAESSGSATDTAMATGSPSVAATAVPSPTAIVTPGLTSTAGDTLPPSGAWRPRVGDTYQIQYSGKIDPGVAASVYELDVDATTAAVVAALHARGRRVLCYVDAGSWENYRDDAGSFPTSVLGSTMDGWPDERWLDIRRIDLLAPIMRARLDTCRAKGFDGVDPDNVDGYTNETGFPLTAADQLRFNKWLAAEAHRRGLSIALKNDGDQAAALAPYFDAAVVEQCVQYGECSLYSPFVEAGKPVFDIEYSRAPSAFCPVAKALRFEIIGKRVALDAYRTHC
jgi:hypothetical protein